MTLQSDIVSFLKRDPQVARLNFAFKALKVYPSAYQTDVADAIASGDIKVKPGSPAVAAGAGASYYPGFDTLDLAAGFKIGDWRDQAFLVHECTHAHIDMQAIGAHSAHEDEATSYIAEAMFIEALGQTPLSGAAIRTVAHSIARKLLAGAYSVAAADIAALVAAVAAEPIYAAKGDYDSNRFDRPLYKSMLR